MARTPLMTLWVLVLLIAVAAPASAAPPANDAFGTPTVLSGAASVTGTLAEATGEDGEPEHGIGFGAEHSVWFAWTATKTGLAVVDTCGSSIDTVLGVYSGSSLQGLYATRVSGDLDGCTGYSSMLVFRATQGTTYRFVVDTTYNGAAGAYELHVQERPGDPAAPPNDAFAARTTLGGTKVTATASNVGATNSHVYADPGWPGTQTVWWRWTSPVDGPARISTCGSDFDTGLAVGDTSDGDWRTLERSVTDEGCPEGGRESVVLTARAGTEYWIGVGGKRGATGTVQLSVDAELDLTPPETTIVGGPSNPSGFRWATISFQSSEEGMLQCAYEDSEMWWRCAGTELLEGLEEGQHRFRVRATDVYGNVDPTPAEHVWHVDFPPAPNDAFADAAELHPSQAVDVNTGDATAEPGEPGHAWFEDGDGQRRFRDAHHSVWFHWTAPYDGEARLDVCDGGIDAAASRYTGESLGALTRVGFQHCSDTFYVAKGVRLWIAVDGQWPAGTYGSGPVRVRLTTKGPEDTGDPTLSSGESQAGGATTTDGAGDPGAGTITGGIDEAPVLRLSAPSAPTTVGRDDRFALPGEVTCATACVVSASADAVQGSAARAARRVRVATGSARVSAGGKTKVRLRLTRKGRRLLARRGRLRARVSVRVRDSAGRARSRTVSVTLRRRAR